MKKTLFRISITIICFIVVLYSVIWASGLYLISNKVNKDFANKDISIEAITKTPYFIRFSKISPYGFPFKVAFKLVDYKEDNGTGRIEFNCPIYIGYDLFAGKLFLNFSGEIMGLYKPLQSKFGVKVITEENNFNVYIPLNLHLMKFFSSNNFNSFEIINFIKKLSYKSGKMQIYDLISNQKIYDQENENFYIQVPDHKYYRNIEDLLSNIPSQINIETENNINEAVYSKRILPPSLLLGIKWPIKINIKNKINIRTNKENWEEAKNNFEIELLNSHSSSDIHEADIKLLYRINNASERNNFSLKFSSLIEIKEGCINSIFNLLKFATNLMNASPLAISGRNYIKILDNIVYNKDKFTLKMLENRKYRLEFDSGLIKDQDILSLQINDLNIFSGSSGLKLVGQYNLPMNIANFFKASKAFSSKGDLILFNYLTLANFIVSNIQPIAINTGINLSTYEVSSQAIISFLKSISDYPTSIGRDISFKYNFDEKNIEKNEYGTIQFDKFKKLYKLELYKKIIQKISNSNNQEQIFNELTPLVTEEEKKMLEKIISSPQKVNVDEIINNLK